MVDGIITDLIIEAGLIVAALAIAIVVLGEVAVRLRRAGNPLHRPVAVVRATVLPAVAVVIFLRRVVGLPADDVWTRVAETALWILCVHAFLSFITEITFGQAREGSWQARAPRLLVDFARGLLIAAAAAIVLSFVWELDVRGGFAALGLGSIVIGLALQDPLGNLFSGLLVALERPFKVGDWLKVRDHTGRIVEINWRATHLQVGESETLVLPNPVLAREVFVNLSRPSPDLRQTVELSYPANVPPERVKRLIMGVFREMQSILKEPAPTVHTRQLGENATVYAVSFSVDELGKAAEARDAFMTRVWYASRREGLSRSDTGSTQETGGAERSDTVRLLRSLPKIAAGRSISPDVARSGVLVREYASGEAIVRQGDRLRGFYLIVRGTVVLAVRSQDGVSREVGRLAVGEFFGALQEAGEMSEVTATAREDAAVLLFQDKALETLLESSPHIYRTVTEAARKRRMQARALQESGL